MPVCNDCGAPVADVKALVAHAKTAHDGLPRIRLWDGKQDRLFTPDGKKEVEFVPNPNEKGQMIYRPVG